MNQLFTVIAFMTARIGVARENKDRGATATEYALLVAFIALAIVVAVTAFGTALSDFFTTLGTKIGIINTPAAP